MMNPPRDPPDANLLAWWRALSEADAGQAASKVEEYSSSDLQIMGAVMEELGWAPRGRGAEAAVAFYMLGKVARALGALSEGKAPSDDTWHDTTVYSVMARRIRETGGWP